MPNARIPQLTVAFALAVYLPLGLIGCKEEQRTPIWYMGHGPELQSKLLDCKKLIDQGEHDANCQSATEAFMTIMTVEAQKNAPKSSSP